MGSQFREDVGTPAHLSCSALANAALIDGNARALRMPYEGMALMEARMSLAWIREA